MPTLTLTSRENVTPGQIIWVKMKLDPAAFQKPGKASSTTKHVRSGRAVKKLGIVITVESNSLVVAHTTTFDSSLDLPEYIKGKDKDKWYPLAPSPPNSQLFPSRASWVYLFPTRVHDAQVEVLDSTLKAEDTVNLFNSMRGLPLEDDLI